MTELASFTQTMSWGTTILVVAVIVSVLGLILYIFRQKKEKLTVTCPKCGTEVEVGCL